MKRGGLVLLCSLLVATTIQGQGLDAGGTSGGRLLATQEVAVAVTNAVVPVRPPTQNLTDKMSKIIIPEIGFRQAKINDVVDFLVQASIAGDTTTTDPRMKGVNIILNLKGPGGLPEITFSAREVSLLQAIRVITQVSGLRYYVEGNAVMIVRAK